MSNTDFEKRAREAAEKYICAKSVDTVPNLAAYAGFLSGAKWANALADSRVAEERARILALLRSDEAHEASLSQRWFGGTIANWLEERLKAQAEGNQE